MKLYTKKDQVTTWPKEYTTFVKFTLVHLEDYKIFEEIYNKYVWEKYWKERSPVKKKELFSNFKILQDDVWDIQWWCAISKYKDWYIIECLFSEKKWCWSKIISLILEDYKNKKIYAYSKNPDFFWFTKLNELSETWAHLFVYNNF